MPSVPWSLWLLPADLACWFRSFSDVKPCVATNKEGAEHEFPSILAAAMWVEQQIEARGMSIPRGGCAGNICRALKNGKTAYGLAWRAKA